MKIQRSLTTATFALFATTALTAQEVPNSFENGQVADATQFNQNFSFLNDRSSEIAGNVIELRNDLELDVASLSALLQGSEATLLGTIGALEGEVDTLESQLAAERSRVDDLAARLASLESVLSATNLAKLDEILPHMSVTQLSQLDGNKSSRTIRFTGVNVQIRNGGSNTKQTDGTGNLILGHAEAPPLSDDENTIKRRTGSHNLVMGREHTFEGTGGIVAGFRNQIGGESNSVLGGTSNRSDFFFNVVVSGRSNVAEENSSTAILGGVLNRISGQEGTVVGGQSNTAAGAKSVVVGGQGNVAAGTLSVN